MWSSRSLKALFEKRRFRIDEKLRNQMRKKASRFATIVVSLCVITALDWSTGYEIAVFPVCFLPIILAASYFGHVGGISISILSAILWLLADRALGRVYSSEWLSYENAAARLAAFIPVGLLISMHKNTDDVHRRRLMALRSQIPVCP